MKRCLLLLLTLMLFSCGGTDSSPTGLPLTLTEDQKQAVFQSLEDFYATLPHDDRQAEADALSGFLQSQPDVRNVRQGSLSVFAEFSDGELFFVMDNDQSDDVQARQEIPVADPLQARSLAGGSAVVFNAFSGFDAFKASAARDQVSSDLRDHGYSVQTPGGSLSELLAPRSDLGVLVFFGHGAVDPKTGTYLLGSSTETLELGPVKLSTDPTQVAAYRGLIRVIPKQGLGPILKRGYAITPAAVSANWHLGPHALVYFGACQSGTAEAIAQVHQALRASSPTASILAWDKDTNIGDLSNTAIQLFGVLLGTPSGQGGDDNLPLDYAETYSSLGSTERPRSFTEAQNALNQVSRLISTPGQLPDDLLVPRIKSVTLSPPNGVRLEGDFPHAGTSEEERQVSFFPQGGDEQEMVVQSESDSSIVATLPQGATQGKLRVTVDGRFSNRVALPSQAFAGSVAIQKLYHRSRMIVADTEIIDYTAYFTVNLSFSSVQGSLVSDGATLTDQSISGTRGLVGFPPDAPLILRAGGPAPSVSAFLDLNGSTGTLELLYSFPCQIDFTSVGLPPNTNFADGGTVTFPVTLAGDTLTVGPAGTSLSDNLPGGLANYVVKSGSLTRKK